MSSEGSSSSSTSGGPAVVLFDPESRAAMGRRVTQASLRAFAEELRLRMTRRRPFVCLVSGDAELMRLNAQFRRKKYATDVLSFPSGQSKGPLGEIAISADRALAQARAFGHGVGDEIRILLLHGVLHLMGFDHETDGGAMARAETRWRKTLGLPLSLTERSASASTSAKSSS